MRNPRRKGKKMTKAETLKMLKEKLEKSPMTITLYSEREALDHAISLLEAEGEGRLIEVPKTGMGDMSDGYHTFNELYHHRAVLFSVICGMMPEKAWKSKHHDDGGMFKDMFIVGIETPSGQATYHYDINPYWDMFKVKELTNAPKWDGHTPAQAIDRIGKLTREEAAAKVKGMK